MAAQERTARCPFSFAGVLAIASICWFAWIGIQFVTFQASGPASRWFANDVAMCNVTNITHTKKIHTVTRGGDSGELDIGYDVYRYGFCANLNPPAPADCGLTSASEEHQYCESAAGGCHGETVPSDYVVGEQTACWVPIVAVDDLPSVFRCGNHKCIKILNPESDISSATHSLAAEAFFAAMIGLLALCFFGGSRKEARRRRGEGSAKAQWRRASYRATARPRMEASAARCPTSLRRRSARVRCTFS